jgi:hypothetical protein
MSFAEIPLPGKIFVVIAALLIAAFMVRVANTVPAEGPDLAAARERLAETKRRIEPDARRMGMTPDEYLATGKAINDALKRYGP